MLFLGVLAFCQLTFLPGYLLLRLFSYRGTAAAKSVYSFALSLVANYLVVYTLVLAGVYKPPVVACLVTFEWMCLLALAARSGLRASSCVSVLLWPGKVGIGGRFCDRRIFGFGVLALAVASGAVFLSLFGRSFGSVFTFGDDVVSWDRWACQWASGVNPSSGYYPQLLPANWSLTYLMIGSTDVKMFAKSIMPLFSVGIILLFADRFRKTKELEWLVGLTLYGLIDYYLFDEQFLVSGYADIPVSFFAFLTFYAFVDAAERVDFQLPPLVFPLVFASAAMEAKQAGVYCLLVSIPVTVIVFRRWSGRMNSTERRRLLVIAVTSCIAINSWFLARITSLWAGTEHGRIAQVGNVLAGAGGFAERFSAAIRSLEVGRGGGLGTGLVYVISLLVLLSLLPNAARFARWVAIAVVLPYFLIWTEYFSYDLRNLALAIPFLAYSAAAGVCLLQDKTRQLLWGEVPPEGAAGRATMARRAILVAVPVFVVVIAILRVVRMLRTNEIPYITDIARAWIPATLFAVCLLLIARFSRCAEIRVEINFLGLVTPILVILGLANTAYPALSIGLIAGQLEAQKGIGVPELNKRLYAYDASAHFNGRIATDYWYLGLLPALKSHYYQQPFPASIEPEILDEVARNYLVDYLLIYDTKLSPAARDWLKSSGMKTEFIAGDFRLLSIPTGWRPERKGTLTVAPDPAQVCDGSGLASVTLSWKTTGTKVITVRMNSPNGVGVPASGPSAGEQKTGKWVPDGTVFYLQDITADLPLAPEHTLATAVAHVTSQGCVGK